MPATRLSAGPRCGKCWQQSNSTGL
ncbi:hypothetical protein [Hymenobacter volaticus]